ncbi:MAG: tyrosine-type recombinase/integrase [Clostridiales bacterium]|jgi:site-specific recombinase XerD|nr:tyrosine-type recombinase/integrase [Clostridiales bacterium]MDR2751436.1 tyrosine-type recombinase/integrase [Clostridiales bacterium]
MANLETSERENLAPLYKDGFPKYFRDYFTIHLTLEKKLNPRSIVAAHSTWNMLLNHIKNKRGTRVEDLTFEDVGLNAVQDFLSDAKAERGWTLCTCNQRLIWIRAFFKYASDIDPSLVKHLNAFSDIRQESSAFAGFQYMSEDAVKLLLKQPERSKKVGLRDLFFMSLMYDTAARAKELINMNFGDLDIDGKFVTLSGTSGKEPHVVPLSELALDLYDNYAALFNPAGKPDIPLFYSIRHGEIARMSEDNADAIIKKNAASAKAANPDFPSCVTPRIIRHTRALHLYRNGMPAAVLADRLGQPNPASMQIYDLAETKRLHDEKYSVSASANVEDIVLVESDEPIEIKTEDDLVLKLCSLGS